MGNRLSRIITRTGDQGMTGLADGSRVKKDSPRIHAIGEVDELNSALGLLGAEILPDRARQTILGVQNDLFDLGGELSLPGASVIGERQIAFLESEAEFFNEGLPMLKEFILPGGCRAAAVAHLARSICRRAERAVNALSESGEGDENPANKDENKTLLRPEARRYLNRLSDLLFILARALNREAGQEDVPWKKPARE